MPKVYIAAAFRIFTDRSDKTKAYGEIQSISQVDRLEKIEAIFLRYGFTCCLPHRDEGNWGKDYYEPESISSLCLRHVETSDVIFAIAEEGRGVHIEIGFASAFPDKKLILMYKEGTEPSTLIWGLTNDFTPWKLNSNKNARLVIQSYKNEEELLLKTEDVIRNNFNYREINNNFKRNIGTIDVGSHTLKFRVFSYCKGGVANLIHKENLSESIIDDILVNGNFSEITIKNLVTHLSRWKEKCKEYNCETIALTGTAALRKAKNARHLLEEVKSNTLLDIDIIDADKELKYLYKAVAKTLNSKEQFGVLGLGGGSVQIGTGIKSKLEEKYFLDFGTNLISRKWSWEQPFSKNEYKEIIKYVDDNFNRNVPVVKYQVENMIYTGGETDFMLKCMLPLSVSKISSIHVSQIDVDSFEQFCYQFAAMHPQDVFERFKLDPKWAIGSIAANTIALISSKKLGAKYIIPSNFNISDGILLSVK